MKTKTLNLHDYIATFKQWEQLWANDDIAFWFERLNTDNTPDYAKGYQYQVHITTPYKNYITDEKSFYCKDLKQAFEQWNTCINRYLESGRV